MTYDADTLSRLNDAGFITGLLQQSRNSEAFAVPLLVAASAVPSAAVTGTLTKTQLGTTVVVPGGSMGPNGQLIVMAEFESVTAANVNSKICAIEWGGYNLVGPSLNLNSASFTALACRRIVRNQGTENVNRTINASSNAAETGFMNISQTNINSASDRNIQFFVTLSNVADSVRLSAYEVWVVPRD